MESPVAAGAVFFGSYYAPGLLVGLAELEIENDGRGFWAKDLKTWRTPVCGNPRMTLTGYHLTFFSGLLAMAIAGATAGTVVVATPGAEIAARVLMAVSTFIMAAVVEDNTWWIYRTNAPPIEEQVRFGEFRPVDRAIRYFVGTIIAAVCFGGAGELAGVDRIWQLDTFLYALAFTAGAVLLDAVVWSKLRAVVRAALMRQTPRDGAAPLL